jgi:hypothetical protein
MEQGTADQNPHHQVNTLLWARADREKTHMDKGERRDGAAAEARPRRAAAARGRHIYTA